MLRLFSLLVGRGAYDWAQKNGVVTVEPSSLISGIFMSVNFILKIIRELRCNICYYCFEEPCL